VRCRDCEYGSPVPLWEINQGVWHVWQEVQTQWRAGAMGIIGLDYAEVRNAFEELGIDYTRRNKLKIMLMERLFLESVKPSDK